MKQNLKTIQFLFFAFMILIFALSTLYPAYKEFAFPGIYIEKLEGFVTDLKFRIRSKSSLKNNIAMVEIDNRTLEQFPEYGRWPWQRDPQAFLIYTILKYKPKLLVLDIIYAESESVRIPLELEEDLRKIGRSDLVVKYSPEAKLLKTLNHYSDKVVLTSGAESLCLSTDHFDTCTGLSTLNSTALTSIEKWALPQSTLEILKNYKLQEVPRAENPILNLSQYNEVAKYFGFSISQPNMDGVLRNIFLRFKINEKIYPALALAAAKASDPNFKIPGENKIQLNFRTDTRAQHSLSAADILFAQQESAAGQKLNIAVENKIKDKIVVLGVTASSASDYHLTPLGILSGPEIVATSIDNLLASDFLKGPEKLLAMVLILFLIILFILIQKLKVRISSRYILGFFLLTGLFFLAADTIFFANNINLPSVWIYLFFAGYAFLIIYEKYLVVETQKDFIKSAFSKYISPDYVNEILNNPEKLKIGGQKKELTIMFSDIRSFTTFSEKMDAKTLGEFLHEYLDEMTDIVFASRGTLDKYIGDAVMAFWGDPLDATDHAYCACEAAKKMTSWLRLKRPYFAEKYGIDLQVGIGINTGNVSVGNMGSSKSLGYTVIGDAVNLTSRLEGATKNYGVSILATENTLAQIKESGKPIPAHRFLDSLQVKGKNESVKIVQIFEQEVPEIIIAIFNIAHKNYLAKNWAQAIQDFESCNQKYFLAFNEEDRASLVFIERCKSWQIEAPPVDWDGSWKLESK